MHLPDELVRRVVGDEHEDRDAWLAARTQYVTASEVPCLFEEGFITRERLAALKRGDEERDPSNIHMRLGTFLEPFILTELCAAHPTAQWHRFGKLIEDSAQPRLAATPDVITEWQGKLVPVQLKFTSYQGKTMRKALIPYMRIQVHAEMACMDAPLGILGVLHKFGRKPLKNEELTDEEMSPLQVYYVERDESLIGSIRDAVSTFWHEEIAG